MIEGIFCASRPPSVAAFVLPNAPIPPETPLTRFVVSLRDLEAVSGLAFFDSLFRDGTARRDAFGAMEAKYLRERAALPVAEQPLALEGPSPAPSPASSVVAPGWVRHLCDETGCVLPRENFWKPADDKPKQLSAPVDSPKLPQPPKDD